MAKRDANIYLEEEQIDELDRLADGETAYTSRSDVARVAVREFLEGMNDGGEK